jgi:hypothetical protein
LKDDAMQSCTTYYMGTGCVLQVFKNFTYDKELEKFRQYLLTG